MKIGGIIKMSSEVDFRQISETPVHLSNKAIREAVLQKENL